ncbi:MAG TPA: hypothetical protein VLD65_01070 [Anaerolineales bacterium]|nr:hypothetical protein [Anaerolineales bacterium]
MSPAVRAWLTRLYPSSWRERYAEEFEALLEQCLHSPLDVVDIILGALDAHLQLLNGENANWRLMNMLNKLRTTILIVFTAYIGFIVAGMALVGILDDSPMIPLMQTNPAPALAMTIVRVGSVVALLAMVVGGLPLAITVIRRAWSVDRQNLGLLLVPIISFFVLVLYIGFIFLVGTGRIQIAGVVQAVQPDNFPVGNRLILAGLMLVFVLGAIASTLAVWKAISHTDVERQTFQGIGRSLTIEIYRFAYIPAVIATVSMLVMTLATAIWSYLVFSALPQVFFGNFGLWMTSTPPWVYGILTVMVLSCLAASFGVVRGRAALTQT